MALAGDAPALDPHLVGWAPAPPEQLAADKAAFDQILSGARAARKLPPGKGDDIAIIVLDTVRADRLGTYGYGEGTSPNLDQWAKSARVYTRATADAPWTLPSHASMFTGQPSRTHGAMSVGLDDPRRAAPLRDSATTIAERLRDKGYETVGIAANLGFLSREYGLAQGFEAWACEDIPADRIPSPTPAATASPRWPPPTSRASRPTGRGSCSATTWTPTRRGSRGRATRRTPR